MLLKQSKKFLLPGMGALLTTAALLHGQGLRSEHMAYGFVFFVFFWIYRRYLLCTEGAAFPRICLFPGALFAVFSVSGHGFLEQLGVGNLPRQAVCFLGFWCLYTVLSHGVFLALEQGKRLRIPGGLPSRLWQRFCRHPFRNTFALCCLFWLAPVLIKYPAAFCPDSETQLLQGLGVNPLTAAHPVFHTMLLTGFYRLGEALGSSDLGLLAYTTVQALLLAAVAGYGICFLLRLKAPELTVAGTLGFFCLSPFVWGYMGETIKDVLFAIFVLLFVILVAEASLLPGDFWGRRYRPVLLLTAALGMTLSRHNGSYLLLASGIALLAVLWHQEPRQRLRRMAVVLVILLVPLGASRVVNSLFDAAPGSIAESLSLPFQQTARFAKYHGDLVTEEEKQIISRVLPYDALAESYNPYLSDPVKSQFREDCTREELGSYLSVWLRQFFRAPGCYWDATMEQNVFLLYPFYNNYKYYYFYDYLPGYVETPQWLRPIQERFLALTISLHELPVLFLVNNMAVYNMLCLLLTCYVFREKRWKHLPYLLPALITLAGLIAAPCILYHVRYDFPVVYTIPILLSCAFAREKP